MTKLIRTLIAGLTLLGVLSVTSIANATQNDEGTNGDKFYYKHTGGVPPQ